MPRLLLIISLVLCQLGCTPGTERRSVERDTHHPATARSTHVDVYHGVEVADPYRWLEDMDDPRVDAWVDAQSEFADRFLRELPQFERIRARLDELWRTERMTNPRVYDDRYFFEYNDGEATLSRLMYADGLDGRWRTLLDPAMLSEDGTTLLARWYPSPDGSRVAWAATEGGSDWTIWRIRNVETGEDLPVRLDGTKFTAAAWAADGSGFYYARYPDTGNDGWDDHQQPSIYFHRLGTVQAEDPHVFSITDHETRVPFPLRLTRDGRFLVLMVWQDSSANGIYLLPLEEPGAEPVRLVDSWDGRSSFLGLIDDTAYIQTSIGAARGRVVAIDLARLDPGDWHDVVPEGRLPIEGASLVGDELILRYLEDVASRVERYATDGTARGPLTLPGLGRATGFSGSPASAETFFTFESFNNPGTVLRYHPGDGDPETFYQKATALDTDSLVTRQVFYTSRDGTEVPMFIVHRDGLELDGRNPTLLYGYGGFNVSMTPRWDLRLLGWLDLGGVLAIANPRGGGEYGAEWHAAGTREHKQNTFDDFIAAAEWLIAGRWTSPERLAIYGRSNGGLLVGAVQLQRPELFAAAGPAVGVLDMLRYHTASANARAWAGDFGLSENESDFRAQLAYSPVHNTRPGTCYPATIIHTGKYDDRVVPWHSYKFAAALQHAQGCDRPILLSVEQRAGHASGGAKPRPMLIDEFAELYAFFAWALGM
jgi:prolyl oligopeptidase